MSGTKKYTIKYEIVLEGASPLKGKEIKIDKCMSGVHAQIKLEDYLKRKYSNFKQLIVKSCSEVYNTLLGDMDFNPNDKGFDDIMKNFGDMFGGKKG